MKKVLSMLVCMSILFSAAACSSNTPAQSSQPQQEQDVQESDNSSSLEVEQNLFSVEITIPASFFDEETTQEALDEQANESGYKSATLNEDGSVTYVMTKAQHKEMMDGIRQSIDEAMAAMVDPEVYPTFKEVTANSDYTEFTVKIDAQDVGLVESFSALTFYIYGGMYHAFNGTTVDDITVKFVNVNTGEVIDEAHSSDAG